MDRERVIILKTRVFRESDLLVYGLNNQGAKVSFIAPSALKSRKRFGGGVLEPTNFIEVIFQRRTKPGREVESSLIRMQEAQILKDFLGLRRDYDILQTALSFLSLVDRVGQEGDLHGEDLFNLLGHTLQYLNQSTPSRLPLFRLHFDVKFLSQQGVLPIEDWMVPLLKCPMKEHHRLEEEWRAVGLEEILDFLGLIESRLRDYHG